MQYEGGPLSLSLGDFKFFVLFIDKIGVTYLHVTLNQFYFVDAGHFMHMFSANDILHFYYLHLVLEFFMKMECLP